MCEIESHGYQVFNSCFIKFVFRTIGDINCLDSVEDSDTGVPSSITIRMEYLHAFNTFNTDIMNYVWKTDEVEAESIVLLIFVLWRCLNLRWMKSGGMLFSSWPFSHLNQI